MLLSVALYYFACLVTSNFAVKLIFSNVMSDFFLEFSEDVPRYLDFFLSPLSDVIFR